MPDEISAGVRYVVILPGDLPREVSPNTRLHPQKRARFVRALRSTAARSAQAQLPAYWSIGATLPLPITLNYEVAWGPGRQTMDDDNAAASCKAIRDGIADALRVNDREMRTGTVTQTRDPLKVGYIRVEIVGAGED